MGLAAEVMLNKDWGSLLVLRQEPLKTTQNNNDLENLEKTKSQQTPYYHCHDLAQIHETPGGQPGSFIKNPMCDHLRMTPTWTTGFHFDLLERSLGESMSKTHGVPEYPVAIGDTDE